MLLLAGKLWFWTVLFASVSPTDAPPEPGASEQANPNQLTLAHGPRTTDH